jgi:hypothetical protein
MPSSKHLTVTSGRITRMKIIFDRAPFDARPPPHDLKPLHLSGTDK